MKISEERMFVVDNLLRKYFSIVLGKKIPISKQEISEYISELPLQSNVEFVYAGMLGEHIFTKYTKENE